MQLIPKQKSLVSAAISLTTLSSLPSAPALAFTLGQNSNPNDLLTNLLGDTNGLSNFNVTLLGDPRAFGTFTDDPFNLTSGIALSTGRVIDIPGVNAVDEGSAELSTDFGLSGTSGDSITLQLSFDADDTVDKLFFQYVFGSEEFVEFGGSDFNDAFSLRLNGINYATLSDGVSTANINNLAGGPLGPFSEDLIRNPVGSGPASDLTKLDAYTFPLLFEAPIVKNATNFLTINVADVNDGIYDTAVFLKGGTLGSKQPPPIVIDGEEYAGGDGDDGGQAIPEPSTVLSLLTVGLLGLGQLTYRRSPKQSSYLSVIAQAIISTSSKSR